MHRRQIRIFLADGSPTGLRIAELGLSTCKAIIAPRAKLAALQAREEALRTGVYILVGPDPDHANRDAIYVGEGDNVFKRIAAHEKDPSKEFWEQVAIFISKDENLTKAHVRHLEAELIRLATEAKRSKLMNNTAPVGGQLPEADLAEMEELLAHMQLLLGTLGIHAFQRAADTAASAEGALRLHMSGKGYDATCLLQDGEFIVKAGSKARVDEGDSLPNSARSTRSALLENGVLLERGGFLRFTQDYPFPSPSAAAQIVCGTTVNGKMAWKLDNNKTLKDWELEQLETGHQQAEEAV